MEDNSSHNTDRELQESAEVYKASIQVREAILKQELLEVDSMSIEELIRQMLIEASEYKYGHGIMLEDYRLKYVVQQPGLSIEESISNVQKLIDGYQLERQKQGYAELDLLHKKQANLIRQNWKLYLELVKVADITWTKLFLDYFGDTDKILKAEFEELKYETELWGKNFVNPYVIDFIPEPLPKLLLTNSNAKDKYISILKSMRGVIQTVLESPQRWIILHELLTSGPGQPIQLRLLPWVDKERVLEFRVESEEDLLRKFYERRVEEIAEIGALQLRQMVLVCKEWHSLSFTDRSNKVQDSKNFLLTIAEFMADGEEAFSKGHAQKLLTVFGIFIKGKKGVSNQENLEEMSRSILELGVQIGLPEK